MITTPLPLYILAGGQSTRFGSDKSRALLDGIPLIVAVARALEPLASRTTVVARESDAFADLGLRTIGDLTPGLGPLGGLATALADLAPAEDWLLLASCDLIRPQPRWVEALTRAAQPPVTAFRGEAWEPLLGLYHRDIASAVHHRLASGRRSMHGLLDEAGATPVALPEGLGGVPQANTREELGGEK